MLIYVAGPLTTSGLVWDNVRNAINAADAIMAKGHFAYVPHLTVLWAMVGEPRTEESWLQHCLEIVRRCDALLRLPGESRGASVEEATMRVLGRPIYTDIDQIPERP